MEPEMACRTALEHNADADLFEVVLYGSPAKTGVGHRTDYAIEQAFGKAPVNIIFDMQSVNLPHTNTMKISHFQTEQRCGSSCF